MKRVCLAAALSAILVAGCGDDQSEPPAGPQPAVFKEVESRISNDFASTTFHPLREIACEGRGVGSDFTCDATNDDGIDLGIRGKIKSNRPYTWKVDGKKRTQKYLDFDWDVVAASISPEVLEEVALKRASKYSGAVSIDCPDQDVDVVDGAKIACTATLEDGSERSADVKVRDDLFVIVHVAL